MTFPFKLLHFLLATLVLVWGCVAPALGPAERTASLRITLGGSTSAYQLAYVVSADWRQAAATLTPAAGTPVTAKAPRGSALVFEGLAPGAGYSLTVQLLRPSPEGPEVQVGRFEKAVLTLVPGATTLELSDMTPAHPTPTLTAAAPLSGALVSSIPATGPVARFSVLEGAAVDASGTVYVADTANHRIRKVTLDGAVTTLAGGSTSGSADGAGAEARFKTPRGLAVDASGTVYVADTGNHRIRKVTPAGVVTTLAGGVSGFWDDAGTSARFNGPRSLAVGASGVVYVADTDNYVIRRVTPEGVVTTLAGRGTRGYVDDRGASAAFGLPTGVAVDASGMVYVADPFNQVIRKVTPDGAVSTLAGDGNPGYVDGPGGSARFSSPFGVAVDAVGMVYVADSGNHRLRKVTPAGDVTTLAGDGTASHVDGPGANARFNSPRGLAVDAVGTVYVADTPNHRLRKVSAEGDVSTVAGFVQGYAEGSAGAPPFLDPNGLAVDASGALYVVEFSNHQIRKVTPEGDITTLAGDGTFGTRDGPGASAQFASPVYVAVNAAGTVYVADSGYHRIRKVTPEGLVTTFAGGSLGYKDDTGTSAQFSSPRGLALDAAGVLYVADSINHCIRKVTPEGVVTTLAGSSSGYKDGTGTSAQFSSPWGVAVDAGGTVYVADTNNHRIRKVTPEGEVTTLAGSSPGYKDDTGTSAQFYFPRSLGVNAAGILYVADTQNHRIREVTPEGVVSTLAGGNQGYGDGPGTSARFSLPFGVALDSAGRVYVADRSNKLIRRITPR
jgi:sugar lactone lactonase YvrE